MPKPPLRAAILGATGSVGQKLVRLLHDHPWFEIVAVAASERSAGRSYRDAVHWLEPVPIPAPIAELVVEPVHAELDCDLAFSALDSSTAATAEPALASSGVPVVSNASALRMADDVPLVVPEVNPDHLDLLRARPPGKAAVVTNPNCATIGLVLSLAPLVDAFGVEEVVVTTLQAVSGAGYPGVAALDVLANVVPEIAGEADKLESEPTKILGRLLPDGIERLAIKISAHTNRVPVLDGHLLRVSARLQTRASPAEAARVMAAFRGRVAGLDLPSAPAEPLLVLDGPSTPQPRAHCHLGGGMAVSVGQVRSCPVLGLRFTALVHNTVRGAAGAAILNAELMVRRGLIRAS